MSGFVPAAQSHVTKILRTQSMRVVSSSGVVRLQLGSQNSDVKLS